MKKKVLIVFCIMLGFYFYNLDLTSSKNSEKTKMTSDLNTEMSGIGSISTNNYANPQLEYYYYIPENIRKNKIKEAPFLVVVPGVGGKGQDFVTQPFKDFAQKKSFIIISPSFQNDANNEESQTSYQYPAAWSGKALNNILNDFISKQNISSKGLYLYGFSAGAQFVERYSLLYSDYVVACAFHAAGGITLPTTNQKTEYFITYGNQDIDIRKKNAQAFYEAAKKYGMNAEYREYVCGHDIPMQQIKDSLSFFTRVFNFSS